MAGRLRGFRDVCVFFCSFSVSTWVKLWGFLSKKNMVNAAKGVNPPPRKVGIPRGISDLKREAKMGFSRFWSTFQNSSCLVGRQIRSSILLQKAVGKSARTLHHTIGGGQGKHAFFFLTPIVYTFC